MSSTCPILDRLQSLIDGTLELSQQTEVTQHLETCEICQQKLEQLAAGDEVWAAAARHAGHSRARVDTPLQRILQNIQGDAGAHADDFPSVELPADFLQPPDKPGSLGQLGVYEILEVSGRGGMGIVLKAFDRSLHRVVAIKVLAPQLAASVSARKRFVREAQAAAAIRDQHVVDIHAVGEEKGLPYLVMEFIAGISLQDKIERCAPLPTDEVLRIGIQTAAGLAAAHPHGLMHRDIKPANILLENGVERVKITDFGLARVVDDSSLTQSGVVSGTPQYMAPEQARGEGVDHRADLFSLGSVLYALCTGHPPFRATGNMATLKRVCDDTPRPIQQINPSVPEWLVALIDRLHAKDPANRFQSAKEVAELLAGYLAHLQGPSRAPLPAFTSARARTGSKQRRRLLTAAVVTLLLAAGALVAMPPLLKWIRSSETPPVNPGPELDLGATTITEVRRFDEGHTDHIVGLAFSPDGKRAASASVDRTIRIWEVESGKQLGILEGHTDTVVSIAFTKDGLRLFSASRDKTVRLWEVETGKDLRQFGERNEELRQVAVSPDGRFGLTAEYDQTIRLWDLDNGEQVRQFVGHTDRVYDVAFSHNGQWALSGSQDQTMRLWDVQTGQEVKRFDAHSALVHSVAFSSDDRRVASAGWDGTVRLWDVESRQQLQCYRVVEPRFNRVVFTPDGRRLLSIGHGGFLRIWDVGSDREVTQTGGHGGWAELALSRDGLFAITATADHRVRLLRLSAGEPRH